MQHDPGRILQTAFAFWSSKVLLTAVEFAVFTRLGSGRMKGAELGADPLPKADIITMGMILHDWNLEKKMHLIRPAFEALPPGGALVAIEALIGDGRRENLFGLLMSLNMLIEFGDAFDFSGADFREWCGQAGFKRFEVIHLAGPSSAAVAYKSLSRMDLALGMVVGHAAATGERFIGEDAGNGMAIAGFDRRDGLLTRPCAFQEVLHVWHGFRFRHGKIFFHAVRFAGALPADHPRLARRKVVGVQRAARSEPLGVIAGAGAEDGAVADHESFGVFEGDLH
jgi:hypothetical protein